MNIPPTTFRILTIGPLKEQYNSSSPLWIDSKELLDAPSRLQVSASIPVSGGIHPKQYLELRFDKVQDFRPDRIIRSNPYLRNILDARNYVREARKKGLSDSDVAPKLESWAGLPSLNFPRLKERQKGRDYSSSPVDEILKMVAVSPQEETRASRGLKGVEAQLNSFLSKALSEIFSDQNFKAMEAGWQGLSMLAKEGARAEVQIGILPLTRDSLDDAIDELLGDLVMDLPSLILVDLPFDSSPRSMKSLERLGNLAETLMVPVLVWITQGFFHLDDWDQLETLGFLPHYLEQPPYGKWNELKKKTSAQWLTITCNRFLARFPYGSSYPAREVLFNEPLPPWISPVWALATLACRSISETGWPTRLSGSSQGVLEDLGLIDMGGSRVTPTEFSLSRDRVDQFLMAGIIPLCPIKNRDQAFFPSDRTLAGGRLPYQLVLTSMFQALIWCNEHLSRDLQGEELAREIEKVIIGFWEKIGSGGIEQFQVSVSMAEREKRGLVSISLKPSKGVLPSHEEIRFDMEW